MKDFVTNILQGFAEEAGLNEKWVKAFELVYEDEEFNFEVSSKELKEFRDKGNRTLSVYCIGSDGVREHVGDFYENAGPQAIQTALYMSLKSAVEQDKVGVDEYQTGVGSGKLKETDSGLVLLS